MAGPSHKIAEAYVEIGANISPIEQGLDEARTKTETATKQIGTSAEKNIGGGFEKAGKAIEDSTQGVRKFQGALSSTVGVVTGLIGTVTSLVAVIALAAKGAKEVREHFERQAVLADEITAALERQADALVSLRPNAPTPGEARLQSEIDDLQSLRDKGRISITRGNRLFDIDDEIDRKRAQLGQLRDRLNREAKEAIEAEEKRAEAIERQAAAAKELSEWKQLQAGSDAKAKEIDAQREENERVRISLLEGEAQIRANAAEEERRINKQMADEQSEVMRSLLSDRLDLVKRVADAQLQALRERSAAEERATQERERRERESVERIAKATERSLTSALERVSASQILDSSALQGSLDRMVRTLDAIHGSQGWGG